MKQTLLPMMVVATLCTAPVFSKDVEKQVVNEELTQAIAGKHRSTENKHRDQYRHPFETLTFFDVKPDMAVVELSPGKGWYTEILAPYLRAKGKLYAAHFSPNNQGEYFKKSLTAYLEKLKGEPKFYDKVAVTVLDPPKEVNIAPDGSTDRVLTFRNIHNWMENDQATTVFNAAFRALKPGGIFGVEEHRATSIKAQDPKAKSGYVSEEYVIALARKAGFEFLAKSEINANPKDTKNYPEGVWTLPPSLRLKDKDKAKYLAIGESDRMTLKFIKPMPKSISSFLPKQLWADLKREELTEIPAVIHKTE